MEIILPYCENCKFSVAAGNNKLECRRNPPEVNPNFKAIGAFPIVTNSTWCGEYQPKKEGNW